MLKVRLLLQYNDDFSLNRLDQVSNDPALSPAWKEGFTRIQDDRWGFFLSVKRPVRVIFI